MRPIHTQIVYYAKFKSHCIFYKLSFIWSYTYVSNVYSNITFSYIILIY